MIIEIITFFLLQFCIFNSPPPNQQFLQCQVLTVTFNTKDCMNTPNKVWTGDRNPIYLGEWRNTKEGKINSWFINRVANYWNQGDFIHNFIGKHRIKIRVPTINNYFYKLSFFTQLLEHFLFIVITTWSCCYSIFFKFTPNKRFFFYLNPLRQHLGNFYRKYCYPKNVHILASIKLSMTGLKLLQMFQSAQMSNVLRSLSLIEQHFINY